jgi:predicted ATPase
MRFSYISLENWRNFGRVDVPLQNRAFLVGPNASGKSNFLDVFRFLRDLVAPGGGFQASASRRGGVSRIRNLGARRSPDVAIQVTLRETGQVAWIYRIAFSQDNQSQPILREEKVWKGAEPAPLIDRPDNDDEADPERLRQTLLEQTFANREFREVAEFFTSVSYFHLVPQLVRDPERSIGLQADPYGGDFLEQVAKVSKNTQEARLRRILEVLQVAVPQLNNLKLERDDHGIPHLYGKYEHWRPKGAWQTEADFSDGTLRLVGLLWSLLDGTGPLLLEEPELSLHPEIVQYIPQMMLKVQHVRKKAARQVFLSTHSRDLLHDEGIAADEVLLFIPSGEGSVIKQAGDIDEAVSLLQAGLTVAEAAFPLTSPSNISQLSLF